MERTISLARKWWTLYILCITNQNVRSWDTRKQLYYTGITTNLARRLNEHLTRKYGFTANAFHKCNTKKLVYAEYIFGNEFEARAREKTVKGMYLFNKERLINSEKNMLVQYIPLKAIILKKNKNPEEQICLKL